MSPIKMTSNGNKEEEKLYMPDKVLPPIRNRDANSTHRLTRMELQKAMTDIKRFVEQRLETDLNVVKHATPLAFERGTGVNDDLDGTKSKSAVRFTVPNRYVPRGIKVDEDAMPPSPYEMDCEVVQSLAKWKRIMLDRLGCQVGEGLYCDSTSVRKGYKGDVTHSVIADQVSELFFGTPLFWSETSSKTLDFLHTHAVFGVCYDNFLSSSFFL